MSELAILLRIELPLALPLMFAGIRTSALFIIGASPLAAIAGGGGLGEIIVNQASYGFNGVLAAAIWVAVLALIVQGLFALLQQAITPRGLKVQAERRGGRATVGVADAERVTGIEANIAA
jgi:osmoprotectant transport system permease protein